MSVKKKVIKKKAAATTAKAVKKSPTAAPRGKVRVQVAAVKVLPEPAPVAAKPIVVSLASGKTAWDALPAEYPHYVRFLLKKAHEQCLLAADSPFPFGKFVAALPAETSAAGIALIFLSRVERLPAVCEALGLDVESCENTVQETLAAVEEKFSKVCGEMSRKWKAQALGPNVSLNDLMVKYLVPKVDRDLQFLVGEILLRSIGADHVLRNHGNSLPEWRPRASNAG